MVRESVFRDDIMPSIPKKLIKNKSNNNYRMVYHKDNPRFKPKLVLKDEFKEKLLERIDKEYKYNGAFQ